jgi:hypothetical protein
MMRFILFFLFLASCRSQLSLTIPSRPANAMTGTAFYKKIIPLPREEREAIALQEITAGNMPAFIKKFSVIKTSITDSAGNTIHAEYHVSPDYLSIGSDADFARIPLTPMTAQKIADTFQCFLPTRKMVNDIYQQAVVKPEPMPLYIYRDSALIMYHHHLIIEGQRKNQPGLIAGIKKDVVITGKISRDPKPNRVAIYGWHKPDGNPIQPLYTGHVDWYVDYSHGIRLVKRQIKVNGKMMDYTDVLKHPVYRALLCDEEFCDCYRY